MDFSNILLDNLELKYSGEKWERLNPWIEQVYVKTGPIDRSNNKNEFTADMLYLETSSYIRASLTISLEDNP